MESIQTCLCVSFFQFVGTMSVESCRRPGKLFNHSSSLANSNMVYQIDENAGQATRNPAKDKRCTLPSTHRCQTAAVKNISHDCMHSVRESFTSQGFSREATHILMSSWRFGTKKQYQTYISRWIQYCSERQIDKFSAPIQEVVQFLTSLFEQGFGYSALNTARGALSSILKIGNFTAGTHPLTVRFMKGVFNLRPTQPRYTETWDVGKVLMYLKSLSPVKYITFKNLTLKLVMLIALTHAARSQTIHLLTVHNVMKEKSQFVLS